MEGARHRVARSSGERGHLLFDIIVGGGEWAEGGGAEVGVQTLVCAPASAATPEEGTGGAN